VMISTVLAAAGLAIYLGLATLLLRSVSL